MLKIFHIETMNFADVYACVEQSCQLRHQTMYPSLARSPDLFGSTTRSVYAEALATSIRDLGFTLLSRSSTAEFWHR